MLDAQPIPTDFAESRTIIAEQVALTVGTYAYDRKQRRTWHYYISVNGDLVHEGDDLSGYGNSAVMMETFTVFLSAWGESVEWSERTGQADSENGDLFPLALHPLICKEIEALAMMGTDLLAAEELSF